MMWNQIILTKYSVFFFLTDLKNCIASTTQTIEQMYCDPLLCQVEWNWGKVAKACSSDANGRYKKKIGWFSSKVDGNLPEV